MTSAISGSGVVVEGIGTASVPIQVLHGGIGFGGLGKKDQGRCRGEKCNKLLLTGNKNNIINGEVKCPRCGVLNDF